MSSGIRSASRRCTARVSRSASFERPHKSYISRQHRDRQQQVHFTFLLDRPTCFPLLSRSPIYFSLIITLNESVMLANMKLVVLSLLACTSVLALPQAFPSSEPGGVETTAVESATFGADPTSTAESTFASDPISTGTGSDPASTGLETDTATFGADPTATDTTATFGEDPTASATTDTFGADPTDTDTATFAGDSTTATVPVSSATSVSSTAPTGSVGTLNPSLTSRVGTGVTATSASGTATNSPNAARGAARPLELGSTAAAAGVALLGAFVGAGIVL
ncbi:hypothetical protein BD413DRAFT_637745 [Trametes elegans]|nr:hypothetical protein BD413DRAFT_637745 [Trametes elegans]